MPLENANYISELVLTNPAGTDPVSEGDDHARMTKRAVQQNFPNFVSTTGAPVPVVHTEAELNALEPLANLLASVNTWTAVNTWEIGGNAAFEIADRATGGPQVYDREGNAKQVAFRNPTPTLAVGSRDADQNDEGRVLEMAAAATLTLQQLAEGTTFRCVSVLGAFVLVEGAGVTITHLDGRGLAPPEGSFDAVRASVVEVYYQSATQVFIFGNGLTVV